MAKHSNHQTTNPQIELSRVDEWITSLQHLQDVLSHELYPTVQSAEALDFIDLDLQYWKEIRSGLSDELNNGFDRSN